ncbi:response regulator transcription factor [Qipengyuania sp. YG27]|uniref:Response regulator transcription factor n=1 Tax=Qipengyuania mesophila TaxID=2867246 RepID=A0ABS7JWA4_9SPHN|nr:response regulator transcription factor [Qipengyuania mesophila]
MTSVLLADDHSFMRAGVSAVLRDTDFEIVATTSRGDDALAAVKRHDPDMCIFDIRMPGKSGVECLIDMRSSGDTRPVVLLTAELDDRLLIDAVRNGVNGIVLKDGAEDALLHSLRAIRNGERAIPRDLLHRALSLSIDGQSPDPLGSLTRRERQVADQVSLGLRNREIAETLAMSEGTVKVYLYSTYQKLGVKTRTELALLMHRSAPKSDT